MERAASSMTQARAASRRTSACTGPSTSPTAAAARAVPGITGLEITVAPGRHLQPLPEGDRYLGFLFARADTPEQVETALRAAHAQLHIVLA